MKKNLIASSLSAAATLMMMTGAAQAAPANTSTTTAKKPTLQTLKEIGILRYEAVVSGGPLSSPITSRQVGGRQVSLEHALHAGVKLSPLMRLTLVPTYTTRSEGLSSLSAASLRLSHSNLLSIGNYNLSGAARLYPAITDEIRVGQKANNIALMSRADLVNSYKINGSRITPTLITQVRTYSYSGTVAEDATNVKLKILPILEGQVSKTISVYGMYEFVAEHARNEGILNLKDNLGQNYFELGANFEILPNLTANPWLDMATGNNTTANMDNVAVGGAITWNLL